MIDRSGPKPRAWHRSRRAAADAGSLIVGACGVVCLLACALVLYRVPQSFQDVPEALRIARWSAISTIPIALCAILLGPRRVLPNLALAVAMLSSSLWWTTLVIESDAHAAVNEREARATPPSFSRDADD